jgi:hypothetical protein
VVNDTAYFVIINDIPVDPRRHMIPDFANMPTLTDEEYDRLL